MPKRIYQGIAFTGIATGVSRVILESCATKDELLEFKNLAIEYNKIKSDLYRQFGRSHTEKTRQLRNKANKIVSSKSYLRKIWRTRFSNNINDGLYKVRKKIHMYDYYVTLPNGKGGYPGWADTRRCILERGSLVQYSHHDELGNVHFISCTENFSIMFRCGHGKLECFERVICD